jgi:predicted molibdopterin-dependent oxidoreductase YjgC
MSTGIFQNKLADLELSVVQNELSSEQPTVADLVLPGTGYKFSDEFACLLNVLSGAERE